MRNESDVLKLCSVTQEHYDGLVMIKNHIAASLIIGMDDFECAPFYEKGGPIKVNKLFRDDVCNIIEKLN